MVKSCAAGSPPAANPGVLLGTIMGIAAVHGRDKISIISSPGIADLGAWLEQLIAESTGKIGKGIVPIDNEPLTAPEAYGSDRLFAYLSLADAPDSAQEAAVAALEKAGHPVVRVALNGHQELGQQFFLWEFATAVAGSIIGINAFNQPDVEASKIKTKELTNAYNKTGALPEESPFATFDGIKLFADAKNTAALKGDSLQAVLTSLFAQVKPGDYVGLLAYVERNHARIEALQHLRTLIRDSKHVATVAEFGPRFLHSTGQAYKGGPNSGVFLQITADDAHDLAVPGERFTFSIVKAAQARGDFDVLADRGRRALRVHLGEDVDAGLSTLATAIKSSLT
jgi:transaldolase/glucose-6-phosphate isomerase